MVGLGFAGTTHLDAYRAVPGVEVVALAGKERQRLAELASSRQVPHTYQDWEDLVARDDLDVVSIGMPNHLHHPIAVAALSSRQARALREADGAHRRSGAEMVDAAQPATACWRSRSTTGAGRTCSSCAGTSTSNDSARIYHARARLARRTGIPGLGSWFTSQADGRRRRR